jgi:hypothetical protein
MLTDLPQPLLLEVLMPIQAYSFLRLTQLLFLLAARKTQGLIHLDDFQLAEQL